MLKIAGLAAVLAVGLVSGTYAQTTGPTGQQNQPGMTNSDSDAMKKSGTNGTSNTQSKETGWSGIGEKGPYDGPTPKTTTGPPSSGTTGMSNTQSKETGWSGISEKGPYDGPAPKTTTGPPGSGSKTESPPK